VCGDFFNWKIDSSFACYVQKKNENEMTYCLREPMETPFDVGKFTSCKFLIRLNSGSEIMEVVQPWSVGLVLHNKNRQLHNV
jgi:hypothetical protein